MRRRSAAGIGAEVELLHVVEFVPVEPMGETLMPAVQIEEELLQRASDRLRALATELGFGDVPLPRRSRQCEIGDRARRPGASAWISSCSAAASATACRFW